MVGGPAFDRQRRMFRVGFLVILGLVGACAGDDDSGGHQFILPDAAVDAPGKAGGELVGTWSFSTCGSTKFRRTLTATSSAFLWRSYWYDDTDSACATPFVQLTVNESYSVGGAGTLVPTAHEIDIRTEGTTLTLSDAGSVADANSSAWCGYTNWKVNVAQDVTGAYCDPDTYWSVGHMQYDLYQVDGNRLFFGDPATGPGSSDGTRPNQIKTTAWYTRQ